MAYTITWEPGGPWVHCENSLTDADLFEMIDAILTHRDFPTFSHYVVDVAQVDLSSISTACMERIARLHTDAMPRNPHLQGIGISETSLAQGLSGVYRNWQEAMGTLRPQRPWRL